MKYTEFREQTPDRAERVYIILSGIFLGALVLTNIIGGKLFSFFGNPVSSALLAYPVTFLVTDVISEVYGKKKAHSLVLSGFIVSIFVALIILLAGIVPDAVASPVDRKSFDTVFGFFPGIVTGSMIAYLTAQYIDVQIFEWIRERTGGKHLWLRNNGSTIFSQMVDTILVATIAFVIWPYMDGNPETVSITSSVWWAIIKWQYLLKIIIAIFDTPIIYAVVTWLKNYLELEE